jgi:radical SAM enzyme (TIGR01210 family)
MTANRQTNEVQNSYLDTPAYETTSFINIKGTPTIRYMKVHRLTGCEYAVCTMCDFAHHASPDIKPENVMAQHSATLEKLSVETGITHFDLLTLGNYFNDNEVSAELRQQMLSSLASIPSLKRVLTESRRQYVTVEKLKQAKNCLRDDQILEYGLGYECFDENVRNVVLNKALPEQHLDECLEMCAEAGVDFVSYVLIKPHTLSEADGIGKAVDTAIHVLSKAEQYGVYARIAFEPVFVTQDTILDRLWKEDKYSPPNLWSVAEVLIQTAAALDMENTQGKLFVGLSDENLSRDRMPSSCDDCDKEVRTTLQSFNAHQEIVKVRDLHHDCKDKWQQSLL